MSEQIVNNKRIAKNTLMLYVRMLLSVVVSLYTSRVVLEVLGVEDYGLYGLVGGVVGMLSFLNSTMASATSRFLTFEMGRCDNSRVKATFSSALIIHIGIALFVLILAETVGLWFLNNKLVIPEGRMHAAHWVFQFSVLGLIVAFTQVPYNAAIIAHEKMNVYAYVELLHVFLKLGVVYLLTIGNFDKLILYAFLVLVVNVLIAFIYRFYCVRYYEETKFEYIYDKHLISSMFSFSAWEFFAHLGYTVRTQGVNIVLNMFFGVVINAVTNIATTVQSTLNNFTSNVLIAIKPQIIKRYASGQINGMIKLILSGVKYNVLIQLMITLPTIFCIDLILKLWLKNPPDDCAEFCRIMLCSNLISAISTIIYSGIQATGHVKSTSLFRSTLYIATPILTYTIFQYTDYKPIIAYIVILASQFILANFEIVIFKRLINSFDIKALFVLIIKIICVISLVVIVNCLIMKTQYNQYIKSIILICTTEVILVSMFFCFIFNVTEKKYIMDILYKIIKKAN